MSAVFCRCDYILDCKGEPMPFPIEKQEEIVKTVIEPMAGDGLRTICIAYKDFRKGSISVNHSIFIQDVILYNLLN